MTATHLDTMSAIDKLMATLDAGETLSEMVRTYTARSMRSQLLGRPYEMTRGDECLLFDATEAWQECAGTLEVSLAAIAGALSGTCWPVPQ